MDRVRHAEPPGGVTVPARRSLWARLRRALLLLALGFFALSTLLVVLYGFLPPPITPLMVIRLAEGEGLRKDWEPFENISPHLMRALIASEDAQFCNHGGFDWKAIRQAIERNQEGRRTFGASTITQQTAKNLFLWPGRDFVRKGLEAYFAVLLELFLDKQRIMELYVNVIEFGPGVYGAEAAAQYHFGKPASELTRRQAALLAVVLPNPREMSASKPSGYVRKRAGTIQAWMEDSPVIEPGRPLCR
jgi:monofunctional biosynthetic peptidoglycan transglycosylase